MNLPFINKTKVNTSNTVYLLTTFWKMKGNKLKILRPAQQGGTQGWFQIKRKANILASKFPPDMSVSTKNPVFVRI